MLIRLLLVSVMALLGARGAVAAVGNPSDPSEAEGYCLMTNVTFSNGIQFQETHPFDPFVFDYIVLCPNLPLTSVVYPTLFDPASSAEVTFNGVPKNTKALGNAISNFGNVANSPNKWSSPLDFQQGINTVQVGVSCNGMGQPEPCYYKYKFTCSCAPPDQGGDVIGDPQFTGLRGQSYQVHGVSGEIYNIVSDPKFQLNSRFVFLDHGKCPVVNGKKQKGCWSHPGSYLGEIGLKTQAGDKIRLLSGSADNGFAAVEFNGKPVQMGDSIILSGDLGFISYNTTHFVTVQVSNWHFEYENSDMYVNQHVKVSDVEGMRAHGLLGQTWRQKTYPNAIKHIQGEVDDYVIREHDIFGDNFVYNVFN